MSGREGSASACLLGSVRTLAAFALSALFFLDGCGRSEPTAPARPAAQVAPGAFDPAALDIERPCSYFTEQDAAALGQEPFYRNLSVNQVNDDRVRCSRGVGAYGLERVLTAEVLYPLAPEAVAGVYTAQCQGATLSSQVVRPAPTAAAPQQAAPEANPASNVTQNVPEAPVPQAPPQPPNLGLPYCVSAGGAWVLRASGHIILLQVRSGAGEPDADASQRMAQLVAERLSRH